MIQVTNLLILTELQLTHECPLFLVEVWVQGLHPLPFSCHVSLGSSNLGQFPAFRALDPVEGYWPVIL